MQDSIKISLSEARKKLASHLRPSIPLISTVGGQSRCKKCIKNDFPMLYWMKKGRKLIFLLFQQNYWFRDCSTMESGTSVPWPNPRTKSRKIQSENKILNIKCGTNFLGCGWKMRRFSQNDDQKTGYDSKKMVCSAFGLQGCECWKDNTNIMTPPDSIAWS
jgi:hypothetical protein